MSGGEALSSGDLLGNLQWRTPEGVRSLTDSAYGQLRTLAERFLLQRFGPQLREVTLQPTALLNETLLRLMKYRSEYESDREFFAIANTTMKRVIVDYLRQRGAAKRGAAVERVAFDSHIHSPLGHPSEGPDVEALFNAIERLSMLNVRKADVAHMRLVWGMSIEEIAEALNIGHATVERDWSFASAWLSRELKGR